MFGDRRLREKVDTLLEYVKVSYFLAHNHVRHKKFSATGAKNHSRSSVAPVQEKHQYTPKIGFYKRYLVSVDQKNSVTGGDALSDTHTYHPCHNPNLPEEVETNS